VRGSLGKENRHALGACRIHAALSWRSVLSDYPPDTRLTCTRPRPSAHASSVRSSTSWLKPRNAVAGGGGTCAACGGLGQQTLISALPATYGPRASRRTPTQGSGHAKAAASGLDICWSQRRHGSGSGRKHTARCSEQRTDQIGCMARPGRAAGRAPCPAAARPALQVSGTAAESPRGQARRRLRPAAALSGGRPRAARRWCGAASASLGRWTKSARAARGV